MKGHRASRIQLFRYRNINMHACIIEVMGIVYLAYIRTSLNFHCTNPLKVDWQKELFAKSIEIINLSCKLLIVK